MNSKPTFLQITDVSKRYAKHTVLDQLNLTVEPNTFFALLGDNGAGKSTLLRMLLGIERPNSGTLSLNGVPSHKLSTNDFAQLGYVSATQRLPADKSLHKLSLLQAKLYPTWDHNWLIQEAKTLELPSQTPIGRLSRGQAMKAKLLLALAHKPRFILLDEPFDSLDVLVKEECIRLLIDWMNTKGGSAIMSSHEIDEVEQLADRVGILRRGHFTHDETLDHLVTRHRRITFRSDQIPEAVPTNCIQLRHSGRTGEFIEQNYAPEKSYATHLPNSDTIEVHPMSLKEIYIAIARESRPTEEGVKS